MVGRLRYYLVIRALTFRIQANKLKVEINCWPSSATGCLENIDPSW